MSNLNSKSVGKAVSSATAVPTITQYVQVPVPPSSVGTTTDQTFIDKAKTFLNKEVVAGSKVKWMYILGAALVFVLYVEFVADRKTKRSLKFW